MGEELSHATIAMFWLVSCLYFCFLSPWGWLLANTLSICTYTSIRLLCHWIVKTYLIFIFLISQRGSWLPSGYPDAGLSIWPLTKFFHALLKDCHLWCLVGGESLLRACARARARGREGVGRGGGWTRRGSGGYWGMKQNLTEVTPDTQDCLHFHHLQKKERPMHTTPLTMWAGVGKNGRASMQLPLFFSKSDDVRNHHDLTSDVVKMNFFERNCCHRFIRFEWIALQNHLSLYILHHLLTCFYLCVRDIAQVCISPSSSPRVPFSSISFLFVIMHDSISQN